MHYFTLLFSMDQCIYKSHHFISPFILSIFFQSCHIRKKDHNGSFIICKYCILITCASMTKQNVYNSWCNIYPFIISYHFLTVFYLIRWIICTFYQTLYWNIVFQIRIRCVWHYRIRTWYWYGQKVLINN